MDPSQTESLRKVFLMFDQAKTGFVQTDQFPKVLNEMGLGFEEEDLKNRIESVDLDEAGSVNFDGFMRIVAAFMEDDDDDVINEELKEAFRMYDKKGEGSISTQVLKEILKELDPNLSAQDLDGIIEEVDDDKSGTVDFDEFMKMMTG